MARTVIQGGLVVNASDSLHASVLIEGERIVAVADPTSDLVASFSQGADVVDATGKYVIPGGIDAHTHMQAEAFNSVSSDTFETGTLAAAFGGTTTILDFAAPVDGASSLVEAVDRYHAKADGECAVDYGFHVNTRNIDETRLKEMTQLVSEGITSFKMFTAYPDNWYSTDDQLFRAYRHLGRLGALPMMHAENGIVIDVLREEAVLRGDTDPVWHSLSRPEAMEAEAVHRCGRLAEVADSPLYIVHLSSEPALEEVLRARERGVQISAETCPQYLFLDLDHLREPDFGGSKFVCSPPIRDKRNQNPLWKALGNRGLATVATDHCPFCWDQKELGRDDFRAIPNGLPGVEHRVEQIYQGVVDGHLSLNRWVEVCSTEVAKTFGLHPRKGLIAAGADADVVIFDPNTPHTISAATHHMANDFSAFEGQRLPGSVETTFLRGKKIVDRGYYLGAKGDGKFLRRATAA